MIFVMFIYTIDYLLVNTNASVIQVFTKRLSLTTINQELPV